MTTRTLHVTCNTRPARLAFLIDKPKPETLEEVFRLNTLLWGGLFNPVVVLDGDSRKEVGLHYQYGKTTYEEELSLLLKEFDPDILINYCSVNLPLSLDPFKRRTFTRDILVWNPWGREEISYFLEVWPFLHEYWRQEIRFEQKPQRKHGYIDLVPAGELKTFLIARFGGYPADKDGNSVLTQNFGAQPIIYDEAFRKAFALNGWLFPIAITAMRLENPPPSIFHSHAFFLLDPLNMFDVVDYWNLRATGCKLFPLPLGHYEDFGASAKVFADWATYPINQTVMNHPEVVKGRSVGDDGLNECGRWLHGLGVKEVSLRGWVPRFGERGDRVAPEMEVRPTASIEKDEIVIVTDGHGTLMAPMPDCELRGPFLSQHWATELQVLGTGDEERTFRLPWLHPECDELVNRKVGHAFGPDSSRVSKQGIVVIRRGERENIWIEEPKVVEVLRAYLSDGGFKYLKTSSPGLTLERIIEQLGGLLPCIMFQNPGVRRLVERLEGGSPLHTEEVRKIIYKALLVPNHEKQQQLEQIVRTLVSRKVLRQGILLQCNKCQRYDWYHLIELSEDFKCKKCFHVQLVPMLDKNPWHYVSDGLFRLEGKVAGCLTAVLSLIFLKQFLSHDLKYVPSFDYTDGNNAAERDFAVFASEYFQDDVDVIIGECKTSKDLEDKQKTDMRVLGERTGAYLAFSTLSDDFTDSDKLFFRQLVESRLKPILLKRSHVEMPYLEISKYSQRGRGIRRDTELLSRLTIIDVLGKEFADKHRLWL